MSRHRDSALVATRLPCLLLLSLWTGRAFRGRPLDDHRAPRATLPRSPLNTARLP
jgi:hypothetical protein